MEEGPKKEEFKNVIGSYMKLAYKNWSREHYVNDEVIKGELKNMSEGKLLIADDIVLNKIKAANKAPTNNSRYGSSSRSGSKRSNHKNHRKNSNYKKRR